MPIDELIAQYDRDARRDRWIGPLAAFTGMALGAALFAAGMLVGSKLPPLCPAPAAITTPQR